MTEPKQTTITYTDPGFLDGSPYEVAYKALDQVARVAGLLERALIDADVQVRNAELQRQLDLTGDCDAGDYEATGVGRQMLKLKSAAVGLKKRLKVVATAASYDPLNPPAE